MYDALMSMYNVMLMIMLMCSTVKNFCISRAIAVISAVQEGVIVIATVLVIVAAL